METVTDKYYEVTIIRTKLCIVRVPVGDPDYVGPNDDPADIAMEWASENDREDEFLIEGAYWDEEGHVREIQKPAGQPSWKP